MRCPGQTVNRQKREAMPQNANHRTTESFLYISSGNPITVKVKHVDVKFAPPVCVFQPIPPMNEIQSFPFLNRRRYPPRPAGRAPCFIPECSSHFQIRRAIGRPPELEPVFPDRPQPVSTPSKSARQRRQGEPGDPAVALSRGFGGSTEIPAMRPRRMRCREPGRDWHESICRWLWLLRPPLS